MSDQDKQSFSSNNKNNFSSMILGVIIGATVTYLFTNKKGQKVKDHLLKEGKKLLEDLSEIAQEAEENVTQKLEETSEEVPEHIEKIQKKGRRFFFRRHHVNPES